MKMAPILCAMRKRPELQPTLIHTGQHYDAALSDIFFQQLEMPRPDIHLEVGSGTHAQQTARVLERMEKVLLNGPALDGPPKDGLAKGPGSRKTTYDRLIVVGDVNSTLAATLAAAKLNLPVAHVEAGLRSGDRTMPEEINRLMTDAVADMLLVSEPDGVDNLRSEGHPESRIHLVGNVMIDTLLTQVEAARSLNELEALGISPGQYALVTLHRPSNVDHHDVLSKLADVLIDLSIRLPVVFPIHPRTTAKLTNFGLMERLQQTPNLHCLPSIGYREFLCFSSQAKVIVTDSGGLQEESTALGIPCLTMRANTERPLTVTEGTSTLIGHATDFLSEQLEAVLDGSYKRGQCPELWDGKASERIVDVLLAERAAE